MREIERDGLDVAVRNLKEAILQSQFMTAKMANANQLSLYFGIGKYVSEHSREGVWGTGAISMISQRLQTELPGLRGFSETSIKKMRQFYEEWSFLEHRPPKRSICERVKRSENQMNGISTATAVEMSTVEYGVLLVMDEHEESEAINIHDFLSLSFTHHIEILNKTQTLDERMFYIEMSLANLWDKYALREYLKMDLYHHQGNMPNNFVKTMGSTKRSVRAISMFKDSYLLDYVNVEELDVVDGGDVDERVVEKSIVENITKFIMQMGPMFAFVGNQYRLMVDEQEFFVDLLFYNRDLRCMVAIELKKGSFKPAYLGQLSFYLAALDKSVKRDDENPSIGIVLCKEMNRAVVQLAVQDYRSPMGVATYRTQKDVPEELRKALPDIDELGRLMEEDYL